MADEAQERIILSDSDEDEDASSLEQPDEVNSVDEWSLAPAVLQRLQCGEI